MNHSHCQDKFEPSKTNHESSKSKSNKDPLMRKARITDPEIAHRLALLENEAIQELGESIKQENISIEKILKEMKNDNLNNDERRELRDRLFQIADLKRLEGKPIDEHLAKVLKKSFTSLEYSKILTDKLIAQILPGDAAIVGEILRDGKMTSDREMLTKLRNDQERFQAFKICSNRIEAACLIIDKIENIDIALSMYAKELEIAEEEEHLGSNKLINTGEKLAYRLFQTGNTDELIKQIEAGTITLLHCKDFIHLYGSNPQMIVCLIKNSDNVADICYALKFIPDSQILNSLISEKNFFPKLNKNDTEEVNKCANEISNALGKKPAIFTLSNLKKDEYDKWAKKKLAQNKFIVGIKKGQYIIAWGNIDEHENHQDIFNELRGVSIRSGGFIGFEEENDLTKVRMVRSSGNYYFYSKELLEKYRTDIEAALRKTLNGKDIKLDIALSSEFE